MKNEAQGQYLSKWTSYYRTSGKDPATLATEAISWFEGHWRNLDTRLKVVPGKRTLRMLRDEVQAQHSVNLTDQRIVDAFHVEEVPEDIKGLLERLDQYRSSKSYQGANELQASPR